VGYHSEYTKEIWIAVNFYMLSYIYIYITKVGIDTSFMTTTKLEKVASMTLQSWRRCLTLVRIFSVDIYPSDVSLRHLLLNLGYDMVFAKVVVAIEKFFPHLTELCNNVPGT
jgi:hypothetical protein